MTPVFYLQQQSSLVNREKEDQHFKLLSISSNIQAASSSCFGTITDHGESLLEQPHHATHHDHRKENKSIIFGGSNITKTTNEQKLASLSGRDNEDGDHQISRRENGSMKWMSSKMRLMHKMVNADKAVAARITQDLGISSSSSSYNKYNNNTIRVCSDCKTTTTPLWRSGPQGPKSLCNACGIRQRKARRAMAEAAAAENGTAVASNAQWTVKKNKEKKSRTSHVGQDDNKVFAEYSSHTERKISFNNFALSLSKSSDFRGVFPQDEEEAAILLMELSCGFVHS